MPKGNFQGAGWTDAQVHEVAQLRKDGLSAGQIAERLHRTRNSITGIMHRNRDKIPRGKPGTPVRRAPRPDAEKPVSDKKWGELIIQKAARLWARGMSRAEIGAEIGRSASAVYDFAKRHPEMFPARAKIKVLPSQEALAEKHTAPPSAPDCQPVTLVDRRPNQCAFPMWEHYGDKPTADSLYCGGDVQGDGHYCAYHRKLMYQPRPEKPKQERPETQQRRRAA